MMLLNSDDGNLGSYINKFKNGNILSTGRVIFSIMSIIAITEFLIMAFLSFIHLPDTTEGIIDPIMLVIIATPLIYLFVIKPYVNANKKLVEYINNIAMHDSLTNLWNNRALYDDLKRFFSEISRHDLFGALLFLDLNKFKEVNDSYGHDYGDAVLTETARRLNKIIREEDRVYRIGGDEFLALLKLFEPNEENARKKASQTAKRIIQAMEEPILFNKQALQIHMSIGVYIIPPGTHSPVDVIKYADLAMYQAKKSNVSKVIFFDDTENTKQHP